MLMDKRSQRCVLALYASGFKLAAAYLDPRTDTLHVMEDLVDSLEWDVIGLSAFCVRVCA